MEETREIDYRSLVDFLSEGNLEAVFGNEWKTNEWKLVEFPALPVALHGKRHGQQVRLERGRTTTQQTTEGWEGCSSMETAMLLL